MIQPFQQPERVIGFFNAYREGQRVTRNLLGDIAQQFQNWLKNRCQKWGVPILDAPEGRRDDFVGPYFKHAKNNAVVVILKAREPARIMIAIGAQDRWHLQLAQRWIVQYNFYINDLNWGRMFVRICPEWREDKPHLGVILRTVSVRCGAHFAARFCKELIVFRATFSSARFAAVGAQWD